ncbi:HEPACAM family member 2, partial [Leptosomus discolor]
ALLICPFAFSAGRNLGVDIKIHQDSVNGTVGQSVLLPVSYRFDGASGFPVSIHWTFRNSNMLITGTVENCSVDAEGAPSNCSANTLPHLTYQRRAKLFPENGSLLLRDLQLDDSGVYSV